MSAERPLRSWAGDGIGIALFALAAFVGASVIMSWVEPVDEPGGSTAFVVRLVRFVGELPLLLLCAASAWLGSRFFLDGRPTGLGRLITTAVLTAGGLALLLGGAWAPHGGALGQTAVDLFGGLFAAVLGLLLLAVPFWHFWLRPRAVPEPAFSSEVAPPADLDAESGAGGLSAAEADALLPKPPKAWPRPPSPYPVDVRLEGRIPEGAVPIQSEAHAHAAEEAPRREPADHPPRTLSGWAAPAWQAAEQPAGADLAALPRDEPAGAETAGAAALSAADEAELAAWRLPAPRPPGPRGPEGLGGLEYEEGEEAPAGEDVEPEPAAGPEPTEELLPAASWEQPGLFSEEEPVDAYGTPIALVETLRKASPGLAQPQADEEDATDDENVDEPESEVEVELLPHRPAMDGAESELAQPAEDAVDEDLEEVATVVPVPAALAAPPRAAAEDELVYQAGVLILERGRVAVSLLQREFKLDFDQATALLDRLQEAGLIGPYVGGQRRDILLTPEEWSEKQVGAS
jgi:hypothetical protein